MPRLRPPTSLFSSRSAPERTRPGRAAGPGASQRALRRWRARLAAGGALVVGGVPGWVLACPSCTARAPESPGRSSLLLGGMMLVPFLLVALGAWAAWRAARGDAARDP